MAYLLIGLSAFAFAVAVLIPTYAIPRLKKIPLDIHSNTLSVAPNSSLIDASTIGKGVVATKTGVPLVFQANVVAEEPADADVVTLQAAYTMSRADQPESAPLSASVDRVTLDRATSAPVADPPGYIQTVQDKPPVAVPRNGFQYKFPFGTERSSYPFFDMTARVTRPIDYVDDARVEDGMWLYHFHQKLDPIDLRLAQPDAKLILAASNWGISGGDEQVTFDLFYEAEREVWVEPLSGAIVAVEEHLHRFLARTVDDPHALTTLDVRTKFDDATLQQLADLAKNARRLLLVSRYAPMGSAGVGLLALVVGVVLIWRTRPNLASPIRASELTNEPVAT